MNKTHALEQRHQPTIFHDLAMIFLQNAKFGGLDRHACMCAHTHTYHNTLFLFYL